MALRFGPHAAAFVVDSVAGFALHGAGGEEQGLAAIDVALQGQDFGGFDALADAAGTDFFG